MALFFIGESSHFLLFADTRMSNNVQYLYKQSSFLLKTGLKQPL